MNVEPIDQQPPDGHRPKEHLPIVPNRSPDFSSDTKDTKPLENLAVAPLRQQSPLIHEKEVKDLEPITIDLTFDDSDRQSMNSPETMRAIKSRSMRPDGITLTAIYHLFSGCLLLLLTCLLVIPTFVFGAVTFAADAEAFIGVAIFGFMSITSMFLCLLNLTVGYGLWIQRQWARVAAIALAFVSLFGFPIFTIIGGLTLWYMLQPRVADEFTR